jgi:two-component system OmpR family sensor kinase
MLGMGLIALVLVLAAVVIARSTEDHLVRQVDDQLEAVGPQIGGLASRAGPGGPGGDGAPPRLSSLYVGRITAAGDLVTLYAPDLVGDDAPIPKLDTGDIERLRAGHAITVGADAGELHYRVAARLERRLGGITIAALPLDDVENAVSQLVAVELATGLALLLVLGLVTWWVIHLGVRPVRRMTEAASAIAAGDLGQRVPEGTSGTEAAALGAALNGMLGRIERAFDERTETEARLRRFIADASHELRTPVATVRGYAELYRTGALEGPGELDDAMRRTEQEALRMGSLIDDLLHLARLDQGRPLERNPVDVSALMVDAARDAQAVAPDREVTVDAPAGLMVTGDEARLRQVVANLVGNALVHAPDSPVHLQVGQRDGQVVLSVSDEGPGMAPPDADHAFERFYRADASRHRHRGGSGLGLAIVEATVRAHGGEVTLDTALGRGTTVRVNLPTGGP